jgi:DNA-binding transcriptional MocR family regulator
MSLIDRKVATPLYYQLREELRRWILSGEWGDGVPLPPEMTLCEEHAVSRSVVRQAIDDLAARLPEDSELMFVCRPLAGLRDSLVGATGSGMHPRPRRRRYARPSHSGSARGYQPVSAPVSRCLSRRARGTGRAAAGRWWPSSGRRSDAASSRPLPCPWNVSA